MPGKYAFHRRNWTYSLADTIQSNGVARVEGPLLSSRFIRTYHMWSIWIWPHISPWYLFVDFDDIFNHRIVTYYSRSLYIGRSIIPFMEENPSSQSQHVIVQECVKVQINSIVLSIGDWRVTTPFNSAILASAQRDTLYVIHVHSRVIHMDSNFYIWMDSGSQWCLLSCFHEKCYKGRLV